MNYYPSYKQTNNNNNMSTTTSTGETQTYFRDQEKVVEKLRSSSHQQNTTNSENTTTSTQQDEVNNNNQPHHHSAKRKSKKNRSAGDQLAEEEHRNGMNAIDANYTQMVKLFQAKEHEISNLPAPDEIRVPLELYTVVQDRMIDFREQLDNIKKENYHLVHQHNIDLDRINKITTERNQLAQALAASKQRHEQVSQMNSDLLKERDHHQGTADSLDSQVRFAKEEAEDRGSRLAAVLKRNDDLTGKNDWLQQQVSSLEVDREHQAQAAHTAQTRLKVALLTTTKLASEKRNLMVSLESSKEENSLLRQYVEKLEEEVNKKIGNQINKKKNNENNDENDDDINDFVSPISGVFNRNENIQEWLKNFLKENDYVKRSDIQQQQPRRQQNPSPLRQQRTILKNAQPRTQQKENPPVSDANHQSDIFSGSASTPASAPSSYVDQHLVNEYRQQHSNHNNNNDNNNTNENDLRYQDEVDEYDDDDDDPHATDAEARAAVELAVIMAIEKKNKMKKFYERKLECLETKLMEQHEKESADQQRKALMSLAKSFATSTKFGPAGNTYDGADNNDDTASSDDDDEDEHGDTSLSRAMRALTQFSSGIPPNMAKQLAASIAQQKEMQAKQAELEATGEHAEISIGDDDDDDNSNNTTSRSNNRKMMKMTSEQEIASQILSQALMSSSSNSHGDDHHQMLQLSSEQQMKLSHQLSRMSPNQASAFIASLLSGANDEHSSSSSNINNNANSSPAPTFINTTNDDNNNNNNPKILRTRTHDPMSKSGWNQDDDDLFKSMNHNNNTSRSTQKISFIDAAQNLEAGMDHQLGKSALFRKFFRDTKKEDEVAAIEAGTESIMTGVKTAETMINYVDECTAQSLSLQDLRDRWEAIKHLVRARLSETASEAKNFSKEAYHHLTHKLSHQVHQLQLQIQNGGKIGKGHDNNNNSSASPLANSTTSKKPHFFSTGGSVHSPGFNRNIANNGSSDTSNNLPMHSHTRYYKANVSSVVAATFKSGMMKNNNSQHQHQHQEDHDGDDVKNEEKLLLDHTTNRDLMMSQSSIKHQQPKPKQRHVAISCNMQPRPETPHWCRNTLVQPKDIEEVDGALFALLPKIFFELHNVIHEVIRESRMRAKVTIPIADPASFIGDGEKRTIADVHCAIKFDMFALMALRDLLRFVGKNQKGSVTSNELRERLVWYKECVESQRLAQLDERYRIDPKLLHRLNIVDRQALIKYRAETGKRFRMPGTLQVPESSVHVDDNGNGDDEHGDTYSANNTARRRSSVYHSSPQQQQQQPDFVRDVFASAEFISTSRDAVALLDQSQHQQQQQHRHHQLQRHTSTLADDIVALERKLSKQRLGGSFTRQLHPQQHHPPSPANSYNNSPSPPSRPRENSIYGPTTSSSSPYHHQQHHSSPSNLIKHDSILANTTTSNSNVPANVVVDPRRTQQHHQNDIPKNNNNTNSPPLPPIVSPQNSKKRTNPSFFTSPITTARSQHHLRDISPVGKNNTNISGSSSQPSSKTARIFNNNNKNNHQQRQGLAGMGLQISGFAKREAQRIQHDDGQKK